MKKAILREKLAAEEMLPITNKETQLLTEQEFLTAVLEKPPAEKPGKARKKKVAQ